MRNFSLKKKENFHRSSKSLLLKIFVAICVSVLFVFIARSIFGGVLAQMTVPIFEFRAWVAESGGLIPSYLRDREMLTEKIGELEEENNVLQAENQSRTILESENDELRALLGSDNGQQVRIASGIIARPPFLPYDALLIDKGTQDGVMDGAVVYHYGDHVIGMVSRAYENSALVTLLSTSGADVTAYIIGPDIYTTAYGEGNGVLRVSVPQGILLQEGDMVILPYFERGVLGRIQTVRSEATEPEQSGFILLDTPIQSMRFVTVGAVPPAVVSFEEARQYVDAHKTALFSVQVPADVLINEATSTPEEILEGENSEAGEGGAEVLSTEEEINNSESL